MKSIDVRFPGLQASSALREHALRRVHLHLNRFGRQLSSVVVRVSDVNGPKGGADKRCQITIRGPRIAVFTLREVSGDPYSAVDLAIERAARVAARRLERRRTAAREGAIIRRPAAS